MCQSCSSNKHCLEYLKNQFARVCDQCFVVLQQQKSKSSFLLTFFCNYIFLPLPCIFCVLSHCMLHIPVHQVNSAYQQLYPLEAERPLLSPGGRRRYLQHLKRWLMLSPDQDALLFIVTRKLTRWVFTCFRCQQTQTTPPWVGICRGPRAIRSRGRGCGSSSKTKSCTRTLQVR